MDQRTPPFVLPHHRLHALDNLRALMMWLGIVLHVSVIYVVTPLPNIPWHDNQTTPLADILLAFIHTFRMPMFFILAGFFVALMVQKYGADGMLKNRLRRLSLPFVVFWSPVFAASVVFALLFLHRMAHGTWGLNINLVPKNQHVSEGANTVHLWFLWMLLWLSVLTAAFLRLARHLSPAAFVYATQLGGRLSVAWWGFLVLSLPLAWVGSYYANGILVPNGSFLPPWQEWLHNGMFYLFGCFLFQHQALLFTRCVRHRYAYAGAGLVFFLLSGALIGLLKRADAAPAHLAAWIAFTYNCASWLWCFSLMGWFLRYVHRPNPVLRYLADSSYWVYIVHMPLTIGFGALMYGLTMPAPVKLLVNVVATTLVCLGSYHVLVRFTWTGRLLHGERKLPGVVPT